MGDAVNLPGNRGLNQPVELEFEAAISAAPIRGQAVSLELDRVDVMAPSRLPMGVHLTVRMRRTADDPGVEVHGRVLHVRDDVEHGAISTIEFDEVPAKAKAQLAGLALWDAQSVGDTLHVSLRGRFDERTDFSTLDFSGHRRVIFDVSGVCRINSWGARQWIIFLRGVDPELEYQFVHVSVEFIKHCNMVTDMLGAGEVETFFAPFTCEGCRTEHERLIATAALPNGRTSSSPTFPCESCGGDETLDEVPARYFAFLPNPDPG